ncbi:Phosphate transporter [Akanthomyces lecanii RCEF 1005]|uniref:Phosphate transporter n=1 Tax=Akanthomyces lecanii RCEF 1005 TaxID=1081108 RepID=A0A168G1D2_CORDF|nr:Phosphate transporter [Akanthomyces lecanii RCEF 1005]
MAEGTMHSLDWLFAIGVFFFLLSAWAIGANDVANSYATSVSSRSLTLVQAGCLAILTEFIGAIALGERVTETIRKGVFTLDPFKDSPGTLILAMVVAEAGSAIWLTACTRAGFPVSATQSLVGAMVGVGIALQLHVKWGWESNSVSQIAASWGIAPLIAAGFGAIIMLSIRLLIHSRKDPLKWALRMIPFYYALTAGILALFVVMDGGHGIPTVEKMGAAGVLFLTAIFFVPYFNAKLVKEDTRLRFWHIPMGPLLLKDNYNLYWPGKADAPVVTDYYATEYSGDREDSETESVRKERKDTGITREPAGEDTDQSGIAVTAQVPVDKARQKNLEAVDQLPWAHPKRIWATIKLVVSHGITRDVIGHQSKGLEHIHARAPVFDNKVEHLWTTAQVCSAMIMSIAHGANDISNAIGPFTTEYVVWKSGVVSKKSDTPEWIKAVGGITLGVGFWTFGYHMMRNLGNRITKHSPTRGYSMELAAAITVLLASKFGLPVSTTQCITRAVVDVALVNCDLKSINWKQLGKIFIGWCLTVPCAGLIAGILMGIAINVPQWSHK